MLCEVRVEADTTASVVHGLAIDGSTKGMGA